MSTGTCLNKDSQNNHIEYHYGNGFLKDLSPDIRRYPYKGKEQFLDILHVEFTRLRDGDAGEWVLFKVDVQTSTCNFLNTNDPSISSLSFFGGIENLLLAKNDDR